MVRLDFMLLCGFGVFLCSSVPGLPNKRGEKRGANQGYINDRTVDV